MPTVHPIKPQNDPRRHLRSGAEPVDWQAPRESIPERIEAIAQSIPNQLAVRDAEGALSYAELDQAANRVANTILDRQPAAQEVIALLMGVDAPAITAALGVLKAGQIYVALDASLPRKRLACMLEDTEARLILADGLHLAQAQELAGFERQVLQVEDLAGGDPRPPRVQLPLQAPALINYTSGSTGEPKGVVQSHRSAYWQALRYVTDCCVHEGDQFAYTGSLAYAASIWVVFGPLCLGATTAPFDLRRHGLQKMVTWLLETRPTLVGGLTTLRHLAANLPSERFPSVRLASMGGDTVFGDDVLGCMRLFPNALVATGYGLSEAGRATQLFFDSPAGVAREVLPLGDPVPGLQIKILSEEGCEAEVGEVGEIVIQGRGLAAGYWRRPELTASQFRRVNSLGPEPAYLTGDLGRWTPEGLLQHMGRKDYMVKIRGYQVFTNEIEGVLRQVAGVREVCVVAHSIPGGARRLVAHLAIDPANFPGVAALHAQFRDIPSYMAPQSYVFLDALPKTPTGKPDRGRLPMPRRSRLSVTASYVAARDPIEEALARIWEKVLEVNDIGVHDNFLQLGGDSLESMRIINLVTAFFGVEISPGEFFDTLTIAEMAALVLIAL